MPQLSQLGELSTVLSDSLISQSHLWKQDASNIKQLDIALFLGQYRGTSEYTQAVKEVDQVIDAGITALISGDIDEADFAFYQLSKTPITACEFAQWLTCVSPARRRAILFALEMSMDPKDVIALEWGGLRKLRLTPLAHDIVKSLTRHFKLKYVFWDYLSNGSAAPLFGLSDSALEVSQGLGFVALLEMYKGMIMIDQEAEVNSFVSDLNRELNLRHLSDA
jgi:hypothetical protein